MVPMRCTLQPRGWIYDPSHASSETTRGSQAPHGGEEERGCNGSIYRNGAEGGMGGGEPLKQQG